MNEYHHFELNFIYKFSRVVINGYKRIQTSFSKSSFSSVKKMVFEKDYAWSHCIFFDTGWMLFLWYEVAHF